MIKTLDEKKIREIKILSFSGKKMEVKIDYFAEKGRSGRGKKEHYLCYKNSFTIGKNAYFIKYKDCVLGCFFKIKIKDFDKFLQYNINIDYFSEKRKMKEEDDFLFIFINKKIIL